MSHVVQQVNTMPLFFYRKKMSAWIAKLGASINTVGYCHGCQACVRCFVITTPCAAELHLYSSKGQLAVESCWDTWYDNHLILCINYEPQRQLWLNRVVFHVFIQFHAYKTWKHMILYFEIFYLAGFELDAWNGFISLGSWQNVIFGNFIMKDQNRCTWVQVDSDCQGLGY